MTETKFVEDMSREELIEAIRWLMARIEELESESLAGLSKRVKP